MSRHSALALLARAIVLQALLALLCVAQSGRGAISGLITDSSGAVVPGAKVKLVNIATSVASEGIATSAGLYSFTALVPGTYRVSVAMEGFQTVVRDSISVEVDRTSEVNLELSPGDVSQTVTVEAEPVLTNAVNSTIGQLITSNTLNSLPMNGRQIFLMVQLTPGVVPINGSLNQTGAFTRPGVEVSAFRINGQQAGSVAYMLDGSPLTVNGYGAAATSPAFSPPLEAVQEYRMENSNLQASVNSPGTGVISLVSKSGTDQFHGSGFYFARPNALAANDPFIKASQARAGNPNVPPDFHRYQWGGSFGGPIRREKLFFFGDYEGTQTRTLETLTTTVPTEAERQGNFSGIPVIYNPFDLNAAGRRQPFAGNQIPANLRDPIALKVQDLIPLPNQPGTGAYHANNYFDGATYPNDSHKFDVRLDYYASQRHQLFGRYSFARFVTGNADHYHNGADPQWYSSITRGQNALIGYTFNISPTTLLQVRGSFTRHAELQPVPASAADNNLASLGFPASLVSQSVLQTIPVFSISGMYGVGNRTFATGFKFISYNYDGIVSVDHTRGKHRMKAGFEYQKAFVNMGQPIAPSGNFVFDTTATSSTTFAGDGFGYASFLLGMGSATTPSNSFTVDPFIAHSSPYYGLYFVDNIRLTSKLSIDAGVRWDIFGGRTERYRRQTWFDPDVRHVVNGVTLRGGLAFEQEGFRPFSINTHDIGPRLGIAYRPWERTVLHAGGGIFYGPSAQSVAIAGTNADSFSSRTTWNAVTMDAFGNTAMLNPLQNPFPSGITQLTAGSLGLATNLGTSVASVWRSQPTQRAYNWNAGIQHELPGGWVASVSYVGSRGLHLIGNVDLNQLPMEVISQYQGSLNDQVPNPFIDVITDPASPFYKRPTVARWQTLADFLQFGTGSPSAGATINTLAIADSIYHSLQAKFEKRLTKDFSMLASFTWGKTIGTGGGPYAYIGQHSGYQNWKNGKIDRAIDPQDISRFFSIAAFYDLPVGRGRAVNLANRLANAALGGWALNGSFYWSTGVPIQVSGNFPNRSIFFNQRPNLTCDPAANAPRTAEQWFSPSCYAAPASPYVLGNAPRTLPNLRADGIQNVDMSLFKNFKLFGERTNAQFRVEAFNLFNSVQLGIPNATWNPRDLSTFGRITSAASSPRQLQFAVRVTF